MTQYINKDALVTEIEEKKRKISPNRDWYFDEYTNGYIDALKDILSFLDTIETKDVDLEKEIELIKGDYEQVDVAWNNDFDYIAKHFFELGLKSKGD